MQAPIEVSRREGKVFLLDILSHRMSVIEMLGQLTNFRVADDMPTTSTTQRVATITFQGVVGSGCSMRTSEKPAFLSAATTSSGDRDVKMSAGIPMESIRSFGTKPTTTRPPGKSTRWISANPASSELQK